MSGGDHGERGVQNERGETLERDRNGLRTEPPEASKVSEASVAGAAGAETSTSPSPVRSAARERERKQRFLRRGTICPSTGVAFLDTTLKAFRRYLEEEVVRLYPTLDGEPTYTQVVLIDEATCNQANYLIASRMLRDNPRASNSEKLAWLKMRSQALSRRRTLMVQLGIDGLSARITSPNRDRRSQRTTPAAVTERAIDAAWERVLRESDVRREEATASEAIDTEDADAESDEE